MGIEEFYKFLAEHKPEELAKIIETKNKEVAELKAQLEKKGDKAKPKKKK